MSDSVQGQELAYKGEFQLIGETSFGVDFQSVLTGAKSIPPEGLRFDFPIKGTLNEGKIKGGISGTDYLLVRADGMQKVHVHAVIDTEDGERIAYLAEGINILDPETLTTKVKATATLQTASDKYAWVNKNRFNVKVDVDIQKGKAAITGYVA